MNLYFEKSLLPLEHKIMEHQFERGNQTELILTFDEVIQTTGDLFMARKSKLPLPEVDRKPTLKWSHSVEIA